MNISRMMAVNYRIRHSILTQRLQNSELNGAQTDCLYTIMRHEGASQMEVAEALFAGKSATAKWVKALIEKGYVRRENDAQDKRLCHLYLTDKGRAIAPDLQRLYQETLQWHVKHLNEAEVAQLTDLMEKVLASLLEEQALMEQEDGKQTE